MRTVAIVPLKALDSAKGRLASVLSPSQRRDLVVCMFERVLAACLDAEAVDAVLVVTGDEAGAALVTGRPGIDVLVVREEGLDAAMAAADAELSGAAEQTLVIAADLAYVAATDIDAFISGAATSEPVVVLSPTPDGGTGALLRRPSNVVRTAFGPGSAAAHIALANAAGVPWLSSDRQGLCRDVDTPAQLAALQRDVVAFACG